MPVRSFPCRWLAAPMVVALVAAGSPQTIAQAVPLGPARPAASAATAAPPGARLQTPVLSLRRVPELLAAAVSTSKLDTGLDAALADPKLGAVAATSCLVVQAGASPIYVHNPTMPLLPASNLKLLTATAALDKLPAGDRFVTTVKGDTVPANGVVTGNLYLVGGGDPLLRTSDYVAILHAPEQIFDNLGTLADQIRAAGVTRITGSVVGDESRYDSQRAIPSWPPRYLSTGEVGPLSALSVNDGFASFKPTLVPAPQPAQQAAATLASLLQARGVTIAGPPVAGTTPPAAARITQLASAPLPDVVDEILRRSDNNGAELLTKELGRQASPATPTTAAGVAVIEAAIAADGLPTGGLHLVDGSGLDRSDRATCQLILATLGRSGPDGALGQGLAVAGKSGTLAARMIGTTAAGRLRAKTGTLEGVSALSGFVTPAGPAASTGAGTATGLAFSLINNAAPTPAAGDMLGDRVGVLLAQFPQVPPLAQLSPLPVR